MLFDEFWKAYPKKNGKKYAHTAFMNIKGLSKIFPKMMEALGKQKKSRQWTEEGGRFVPNPAAWIHQERWNDEGVRDLLDEADDELRKKHPEWYPSDDDGKEEESDDGGYVWKHSLDDF